MKAGVSNCSTFRFGKFTAVIFSARYKALSMRYTNNSSFTFCPNMSDSCSLRVTSTNSPFGKLIFPSTTKSPRYPVPRSLSRAESLQEFGSTPHGPVSYTFRATTALINRHTKVYMINFCYQILLDRRQYNIRSDKCIRFRIYRLQLLDVKVAD
jgi:hypothetical protein